MSFSNQIERKETIILNENTVEFSPVSPARVFYNDKFQFEFSLQLPNSWSYNQNNFSFWNDVTMSVSKNVNVCTKCPKNWWEMAENN